MHNKKKEISHISISVIGGYNVGKTSFIKCLASGGNSRCRFVKYSLKNDFKAIKMKLDQEDEGHEAILQLWENEASSFHAICLLYDVTSRESYEQAVINLNKFRDKHPKLPIMLLANKLDLEDKRVVMEYEGEINAIQHSTLFNEISCLHGSSVQQSVEEFVQSFI